MKKLIALSLLLIPNAHAAGVASLFGTSRFTPNQAHTVTGPLVQFKTAGGTTLSFQQGSKFSIDDAGIVTLTQGNLRVGPAGGEPLTVNLPQGPVTVAPLTALTVTAENEKSTGRIYQGNLVTDGRTFTTGEGFILTPSGAHGTFTPAAAQAPAMLDLASIEPAAGPATSQQTPPTSPTPNPLIPRNTLLLPNQPNILPVSEEPTPEQPVTEPETPVVDEPAPEQPQPPVTETPTPADPVTEPPVVDEPVTEPPVTEPPVIDEPVVETPVPEIPIPIQRTNLLGAYTEALGLPMPTGATLAPGTFTLNEYADGTEQLTELQTRNFRTTTSLNIGSAQNLESTSNGATAGLGRWVGGELVSVVTNAEPAAIAHSTATDTETPTPNSLHYVWGEKPTNIPTSGHVEYSLFAATQPTYVTQPGATALASTGGTFAGNLSIDFAPGFSGNLGTYNLNGNVTMPQVTQTDTGPVTTPTTYTISTPAGGVALTTNFTNNGTLNVTAPTGAIACPGGTCTGTVNAMGFGSGMQTAGALYAINPTGPVAVTGAALFTANPAP